MTIIIPDPLPENIIPSYVVDPINSKSITLPLTSPIPNHHNNNHNNHYYYYQHHHQQYQCPVQSSSSEFQIKYIQTAPINFPSSSTSIPLTDVILPIKPTVTKQAQTVLPDQDLDHDQRIVPTSTTSYASFEITSGSISQSPYYSSLFLSPHNPPYEPDSLSSSPRQSQSQSNLQSRNRNSNYNHNRCPQINTAGGSLMTRGGGGIRRGGFDGIVEERYSRFRPSDSQHNNEIIMIGLHPFQQENYGISKKNIFDSLTNWFKWKSSSSTTSSEIPPPLISSNQIINHQEDKSSDDDNHGNNDNNDDNDNETIIITQEHNDFTPQPVYTPRGIPINEFPLNFNKEQNEENNLTRCRNEDIINSFDDDVRDLINGVDNFLISCLENCWNLIKSTSESCITLCD